MSSHFLVLQELSSTKGCCLEFIEVKTGSLLNLLEVMLRGDIEIRLSNIRNKMLSRHVLGVDMVGPAVVTIVCRSIWIHVRR